MFLRPRSSSPRCRKGFTLIELMVTLAIVAILAALAAPSLQAFMVRNTFASIGNEFSGSILRARNEAVTRNICTTMCMSDTVDNATPFCKQTSVDDNWQVGWIVFINPDCDTDYGKNAGANAVIPENLILVRRGGNPNYTLIQSTRRLNFDTQGRSLGGNARFVQNYQSNPEMDLAYSFDICLDILGRTRSIPSTSNSCSSY